jgi:hypothetical protein
VPQAPAVGGSTQTGVPSPSRLQQPLGQVWGVQAFGSWQSPFRQTVPASQTTQAAPLAPQAASVGGLTQAPPAQQPAQL